MSEGLLYSVSADGDVVAFASKAKNLHPSDEDSVSDIYVKNLLTGQLTLASITQAGDKGDKDSHSPAVSADGTKVAFVSEASNLVPDTPPDVLQIYVKDIITGAVALASASDAGDPGDNNSYTPSLSWDGSRVAFSSYAYNLDPAGSSYWADVYVKDLSTGELVLASSSDAGETANTHAYRPSLTPDGTKVSFDTRARNLDSRDGDILNDIYLKDLITGDVDLVSLTDAGNKRWDDSFTPVVNVDGTRVAFTSYAPLDRNDEDEFADAYVKDLVTGDIVLASTADDGSNGSGFTVVAGLTSDGMRVAFTSEADDLDPADRDKRRDAYVKDLLTGDLILTSTSDGGDKGIGRSDVIGLSGDGSFIAFSSTAPNLDPDDTDQFSDIYVKSLPPAAWCNGAVATVVGTSMADRLVGTPGADVIAAIEGDDAIDGRGGEDTICTGAGADHVLGGTGSDLVVLIDGIQGNDMAKGERGQDICRADPADRLVSCGPSQA